MKYFDGHNDVLLKFYFEKNKDSAKEFFNGNDFCHIDFPKILKIQYIYKLLYPRVLNIVVLLEYYIVIFLLYLSLKLLFIIIKRLF